MGIDRGPLAAITMATGNYGDSRKGIMPPNMVSRTGYLNSSCLAIAAVSGANKTGNLCTKNAVQNMAATMGAAYANGDMASKHGIIYPSLIGMPTSIEDKYTKGYLGYNINHLFTKGPKYGTSFETTRLAQVTGSLGAYSKTLTESQLVTKAGIQAALPKYLVDIWGIPQVDSDKYFGGGTAEVVAHFKPLYKIQQSNRVPVLNYRTNKIRYYGGSEVLPMTPDISNDIVRSIDKDYDELLVTKKRDLYKNLLDKYESVSLNDKITNALIHPAGSYWKEDIKFKISDYVNSLDQYIDTKDYSLLSGISQLEYNAITAVAAAGFSETLEKFYAYAYSDKSRYEYAGKRFTAIIRQKCKIKTKLDLRITFRKIIRFLFKNMDDESGDLNVEVAKQSNVYSLLNSIQNDRDINNNSVKNAA